MIPRPLPFWRLGLPVFLGRPRTAMERLRAFGAAHGLDHFGRRKKLLTQLGMTLAWPFVSLGDAVSLSPAFGRATGAGRLKSFVSLYGAALSRNVPPGQHLRYADLLVAADALPHLLFPMDVRAFDAVNRALGADFRDVEDKARFAELCERLGLAHLETVAVFRRGAAEPALPEPSLGADLFVKPLKGKAGGGAERWRAVGDVYRAQDGRTLPAAALSKALADQDVIVQPVARNAVELGLPASAALACLRIVTARLANGEIAAIAAVLSLETDPDALISHKGRMYSVALASGALRAADSDPSGEPDPLNGAIAPFWGEAVALVRRAHALGFGSFFSLGWDVALTEAGPVLIEANQGWNMTSHQVLDGPIGETLFSEAADTALHAIRSR